MFDQSQIDAIIKDNDGKARHNIFTHTMIRIKDPLKSLTFYIKHLGFDLIEQRDFPKMKFSLFFLKTLAAGEQVPTDIEARHQWMTGQAGLLELTYNYDTELDEAFSYHNGNEQPRGFGHIAVSVPDVEKACADFSAAGIEFVKRLDEGSMRDIAFIKDPDGYWVEIIGQ